MGDERKPKWIAAESSWQKSRPDLVREGMSFDDYLIALHKAGRSNERIAKELYLVTDRAIDVSFVTVRHWLADAIKRQAVAGPSGGIPDPRVPGAESTPHSPPSDGPAT